MILSELNTVPAGFAALTGPLEKKRAQFIYGIDPVQDQVEHELTKFGFEYAGAGRSGIVFSHPSKDYVIKVSVIDDVAYTDFIKICHTNPHFPKIIGKPFIYKNNFLITRIEKLSDLSSKLFKRADNATLSLLGENNIEKIPFNQIDADNFLEDFPEWESAIKTIIDLTNRHNQSFIDFHEGNVMSRSGFPVIVDPIGLDYII